MKVRCLIDHNYGQQARMNKKQAMELDLDPKKFSGGWDMQFKAGEEYDLDEMQAIRLLRDYGPNGIRPKSAQKFTPVNQDDLLRVVMLNNGKISLKQAMEQGYVTPPDDMGPPKPQSVTVDPEGVPA